MRPNRRTAFSRQSARRRDARYSRPGPGACEVVGEYRRRCCPARAATKCSAGRTQRDAARRACLPPCERHVALQAGPRHQPSSGSSHFAGSSRQPRPENVQTETKLCPLRPPASRPARSWQVSEQRSARAPSSPARPRPGAPDPATATVGIQSRWRARMSSMMACQSGRVALA